MIIRQDGQETDNIDFGMVQIGLSRNITLEVENNGTGLLENLTFAVEGAEVVSAPTSIAPGTTSKVVLRYTPPLDLNTPLRGILEIKGSEIWR